MPALMLVLQKKDDSILPPEFLLTFDEIMRFGKLFKVLGTKKIRVTGGEPGILLKINTVIVNFDQVIR